MNYSIFLLLGLTASIAAAAITDPNEKCPYRSTVDLRNQEITENGSYIYQGVLIPPGKQSFYDKHYRFKNESVSVPVHLRGCVCSPSKRCIKLCCETDDIFNNESFQCERLSKDKEISWDLPIRLSDGTDQQMNVLQKFIYQVGVPCDEPEPLIKDIDKWILLENGEVFIEREESYLDTVNYCFSPYKSEATQEYSLMAYSCPIENKEANTLVLNTYAMALSVVFLIPTIVVYMILKELRGNLRGKILICYLLSLAVAYSVISFINISRIIFEYVACSLLGYTCYYFFMAAFLWLSVLCYDIWSNFKENNIDVSARDNKKRFIQYSVHAWGGSSIFTLLTVWADYSTSIEDLYKPGIGYDMCWVNTSKWSAAIYFYGPNLIILICNLITFAFLTVHIYRVRRASAQISHKERFFQENYMVILRLFLIMGVSWIFDILSFCLPDKDEWQYMFIISDLINALQGLLIFTLFVLKRNVLDSLKNRFTSSKPDKPRRSTLSLPINNTRHKVESDI